MTLNTSQISYYITQRKKGVTGHEGRYLCPLRLPNRKRSVVKS